MTPELVHRELPHALVAVEEIGVGFKVSTPFPPGELWGEETVVPMEELLAELEPELLARDLRDLLRVLERRGELVVPGEDVIVDGFRGGLSRVPCGARTRRSASASPR